MAVDFFARMAWSGRNAADAAAEALDSGLTPAAQIASGAGRFAAHAATEAAAIGPLFEVSFPDAAAKGAGKAACLDAARLGARIAVGMDAPSASAAQTTASFFNGYGATFSPAIIMGIVNGSVSAAQVMLEVLSAFESRLPNMTVTQARAEGNVLQRICERLAAIFDARQAMVAPPPPPREPEIVLLTDLLEQERPQAPAQAATDKIRGFAEAIIKSRKSKGGAGGLGEVIARAPSRDLFSLAALAAAEPEEQTAITRSLRIVRRAAKAELMAEIRLREDTIVFAADRLERVLPFGAESQTSLALASMAEGVALSPVAGLLASLYEGAPLTRRAREAMNEADIIAGMDTNPQFLALLTARGVVRVIDGEVVVSSSCQVGGPLGGPALRAAYLTVEAPKSPVMVGNEAETSVTHKLAVLVTAGPAEEVIASGINQAIYVNSVSGLMRHRGPRREGLSARRRGSAGRGPRRGPDEELTGRGRGDARGGRGVVHGRARDAPPPGSRPTPRTPPGSQLRDLQHLLRGDGGRGSGARAQREPRANDQDIGLDARRRERRRAAGGAQENAARERGGHVGTARANRARR